jgi:hypothetical protein
MFAYERESDSTLVVGAGIPEPWVTADPGVVIRGLSTHYGKLDLSARAHDGVARVRLARMDRIPPGGIVVMTPLAAPIVAASINGRRVPASGGGVIVRELPADVSFQH